MNRDPELYFFTVFGTPSAKGPWGWRVNGHHLSVHFMVADGSKVASSPTFFGTNPAEVREGPKKGLRIQAAEQDAGRALVNALDESQRKTAIIGDIAPNDIVTTTDREESIRCRRSGVMAAAMTGAQNDLLDEVDRRLHVADERRTWPPNASRKSRRAGIEKIGFAWAGPIDARSRSTTTACRDRRF